MMGNSSDPLSEALESLHLRVRRVCRLNVTQPGGARLPAHESWLHMAKAGICQVAIEQASGWTLLEPGDLMLLQPGNAHRLRDHRADPMNARKNARVQSSGNRQGHAPHGWRDSSADAVVVSVCLDVDALRFHPIYTVWPSRIHVRQGDDGALLATLPHILADIERESAHPRPGSHTIVSRLVGLLVAHAVQRHVLRLPGELRGVLKALLTPDIGPAVALMHSHPERPWTIASLSKTVSMSSMAFTTRFENEVGVSPGRYLLNCRMHTAAALLAEDGLSMKEIAGRTGYQSASAFSKAFKRWTGLAPSDYRKSQSVE
jgi:AraC-like DNA-binding protein